MNHAYVLTLSCPDKPGIVHAVSGFLLERGGNIEEAAQYNDHGTGLFFMRVQFACDQLTHEDLKAQWKFFAETFAMKWDLHVMYELMFVVFFVSREGYCFNDFLFCWKSGLFPRIDVCVVIFNYCDFY